MPYNSDGSHQDNNRVSLGGLWQQTDRNGNKYLSGSLGAFGKLLIFPNCNKTEGSNQPDYNMVVVEKQRDGDKPPDNKPPDSKPQPKANTPPPPQPPADDDAPF